MSRGEPTILDAYRWADDAGLTVHEHRVLCTRLRSAGEDGEWITWTPRAVVERRTDMDPKTIRKAEAGLVEKGIIECVAPATYERAARFRINHEALRRRAEGNAAEWSAAKAETRPRGRPAKMGGMPSPSISENGGDAVPPYSGKMGGMPSLNGGDAIPKWGGKFPPRESLQRKPTEVAPLPPASGGHHDHHELGQAKPAPAASTPPNAVPPPESGNGKIVSLFGDALPSPAPASPEPDPDEPLWQVARAWNECACDGAPQVHALGGASGRRAIAALLARAGSIENVRAYFRFIADQPFLTGRGPTRAEYDRPFFASLRWACRPDKITEWSERAGLAFDDPEEVQRKPRAKRIPKPRLVHQREGA